jgi:hypothetical protein
MGAATPTAAAEPTVICVPMPPQDIQAQDRYLVHVTTDKGLYKPGETLSARGHDAGDMVPQPLPVVRVFSHVEPEMPSYPHVGHVEPEMPYCGPPVVELE